MKKETRSNGMVELTAADGRVLRRIGSDPYSDIKKVVVAADRVAEWEEVAAADIPPHTKAEYDAKVAELVRGRYSESEEFAIQRKMINAMLPRTAALSEDGAAEAEDAEKAVAEYSEYNGYVERCKAEAPEAIAEDRRRREEEAGI